MESLEKQLRKHDKEWLASTLSCVGDAILTTNAQGMVDFVNHEAQQVLGQSFMEIVGRDFHDVFRIFVEGKKDPSILFDKTNHESFIDHGLLKSSYLLKKSGGTVDLSAHISKLHTEAGVFLGYVVVFRDITKIIEAERAIKKEKDNLQLLFEMLPTGMVVLDESLIIQKVNQTFLDHFKLNLEYVLNKPIGEAVQCIWSASKGCGQSSECQFCNLRKTVTNLIRDGKPARGNLVGTNCKIEGAQQYCWLNLGFMPVELEHGKNYILTLEDVTERVNYEKSLEEARKSSLTLLDSLPVMIYRMDDHKNCNFINQTFKSYTSINHPHGFEDLEELMSVSDYTKLQKGFESCIARQVEFNIDIQLKSATGNYKYVLGLGKPIYDENNQFSGMIGIFLDVDDAKRSEELYRQSQNKYFSLFRNMESSISYHRIIYDDNHELVDTEIIEMNQVTHKVFGEKAILFAGSKLTELSFYSHDDMQIMLNMFKRVAGDGDNLHLVECYFESIGKWLEISMYSPEPGYIALLISDIDYKKRVEIELKQAKERAEEANRAKSEFLANMSHEIRTPLNGIVGMVDLTMMGNLSEDQKENLHTAKDCVNSLIDIINDVLDFSKIEAGKLRLEAYSFELSNVIETTLKTQASHASEKGLWLNLEYNGVESPYLIGDARRIKQVLNNLISNAIKFTNEGSVSVSVAEHPSDQEESILLEISVSDTGIGISEEKKELLFKSFTQIDGSYTRQYGGTGLGLIISKQLVEMMGGTICFESNKDSGSKFTFQMPLMKSEKVEIQSPIIMMKNDKYRDKEILIVEDDRVNQIVVGKMLEAQGFKVDIANNGLEALEKNAVKRYDVILMDIQMPQLDGIQATQRIRSDAYGNSDVPIIALTAFALKGDEEIFRASGMNDYISKPVDRAMLLGVIDRYLKDMPAPLHSDGPYDQGLAGGILASVDESGSDRKNPKMDIDHMKQSEIWKRINQLKGALIEGNTIMLEIIAHQLKVQFEELNAEELKNIAFKMELEIRKGRLEKMQELLDRIEYILNILTAHKAEEDHR